MFATRPLPIQSQGTDRRSGSSASAATDLESQSSTAGKGTTFANSPIVRSFLSAARNALSSAPPPPSTLHVSTDCLDALNDLGVGLDSVSTFLKLMPEEQKTYLREYALDNVYDLVNTEDEAFASIHNDIGVIRRNPGAVDLATMTRLRKSLNDLRLCWQFAEDESVAIRNTEIGKTVDSPQLSAVLASVVSAQKPLTTALSETHRIMAA